MSTVKTTLEIPDSLVASAFELNAHGLTHQLNMFVAPSAPVKIYHLQLRNTWQRARRLTVTLYAEWVLGTTRAATQQFIVPEFDADSNGMLVRNVYNSDFGDRIAFAAADRPLHGITADRTEFIGHHGSQGHTSNRGPLDAASTGVEHGTWLASRSIT